jgi:transcription-repair coupling factor (superfamily II helicase)
MKDVILKLVSQVNEVKKAAAWFGQGRGVNCFGLSGTAKATFISAVDKLIATDGSLVFLVAGRDVIREYRQTLSYFYPNLPLQELYPTNLPRVKADSRNLEIRAGRVAALRLIRGEEKGIVFITPEALLQKQARPQSVDAESLEVCVGQVLDRQAFLHSLDNIGYEHTEEVDTLGQYAVRGEILDVFPLNTDEPVRIEWMDNVIDGIRSFDLTTKRSTKNLEAVKITPLKSADEDEIYDSFVFDYAVPSTRFILDDPLNTESMLQNIYKEGQEWKDELWQPEEITGRLAKLPLITVAALGHDHYPDFEQLPVPVRAMAPYNKNLKLLLDDLQGLAGGWQDTAHYDGVCHQG